MNDILDTINGTTGDSFPLENLIPQALNSATVPQAALRNRAATAAMLDGNSERAIEKYQSMVAQGQEGGDTQAQGIIDAFHQQDKTLDMKAVMGVLSDPNLSLDQKQGALDAVKNNKMLSDSGTSLFTKNLQAGSSGETQEAEDARISTASAINEMYKSKELVQGLVNAASASRDISTGKAAVDMYAAVLAPFATSMRSFKLAKAVAEANGQKFTAWDAVKAATIGAGTVTADARANLEALSPQARVKYAQTLVEAIKSNSGLLFANDNQYAEYMRSTQIFEEGGYSNTEKFIDNVSFLLDAIGVGQILKSGTKAVKGTKAAVVTKLVAEDAGYSNRFVKGTVTDVPYDETVKRIEANSVVRQEHPASVASAAQSNPEKARAFHEAAFKSADDVGAEAVYGTSKEQAIINDVFPQATTASGSVLAKVADVQRNLRLAENLTPRLNQMLAESDVAIHYSIEEKKAARAQIIRDYSSATDLVPVDSMGGFEAGFKLDGSGLKISAVYGSKEGAFLNAQEAYQQALFGLRKEGIQGYEVEVLAKQGMDYVPVDLKAIGNKEGSYLVRVKTERMINNADVPNFETETVKRNFFDRSPVSVWNQNGSVSRWMFDAASMISPRYTGAAVVATDITSAFEKEMLHIADAFAGQFNGLDKIRKAKVNEYIKESNFKGLPFDTADLVGRGFVAEEIDTLRSWRDFWDSHFYLENHDVIRSLNSSGFQMFKTPTTELYAKSITKNSNVGKVYDPATGIVMELSQQALDDLYVKGGTLAKLRRPTEFSFGMPYKSGVKQTTASTEHMIVRNTPTEYLRKFRDTDQVLNYREGYYQIQYKAPRFIDEIVKDSAGIVQSRRAIAVAGDTAEAEHFATRQRRTNPDKEYIVRGDDKAARRGGDDWFDLNSASGRIAQKHRGKLLEDSTGVNHLGDGTYIVSPVESAIRAAKSISGRTVTRPMLETAKARFISQYEDLLPSNGFGGKVFPSSPGMIGEKGAQFAKKTADARTTWEYIHYLENGYINSVDEFFKQQFNALSTAMGDVGMARTERALALSAPHAAPTQFAKNVVFQAYIALNPLHNWIAQSNQVVRTFMYNPQSWLTGSMPKLIGEYSASKLGISVSKDGEAFVKFFDNSGLGQSVDKQNLIRGSLLQAADSSNKAVRMAIEVAQLPRKLGFDVGETFNLLGHAAAVFDKYKRAGKDVTETTVMREMHSELRAISYDMNFAGDMVYNQTSAAAMLQFLQVPHKAFLQATNRRIPWELRARMLAGDVALFGVPIATIGAVFGIDEILPENSDLKNVVTEGLQSFMLNTALSELMGEKVGIDFSPLSAESLDGWAKIFHGMFSQGMSQVMMNSPAGQMFLAEGGRFQNAISQMSKFFSPWTPGERTNEEAIMLANEIAKISSGWSNAMKAKQQFELKKSMDKYGNVIDPEINNAEALLQIFGYTTQDTRKLYETQKVTMEGTKQYADEVKKAYKDIKQYYQSQFDAGITNPKQMQAVTGQMLQAYKESPVALDIISKELAKDLAGKDQQLLLSMMKSIELPRFGITIDQIKMSPLPDEQKNILIQRLTDAKNARSEIKKDK